MAELLMSEAGSLDQTVFLTSGLLELLFSSRHTDTIINVEGRTFHCHRVVLCAMSRYFDAMFSSGMLECQAGKVTLYNVHQDMFALILHFMYGQNMKLTMDNVTDLLELASLYQIPALQSKCERYLAGNLNVGNSLSHWKLASLFNCTWLRDQAWEMVIHNFKEVAASEEFLEITKEELITLITEEHLQVNNEEDVCESVMLWLEHDNSRMEYLLEIFQLLKLPLLSKRYLEELLERKSYLREHEKCSILLTKHAHMLGLGLSGVAVAEDHEHFSMFQDRSENVLVMVDGRRQEVACFSLQRKKTFALAKFPYFADGKAACVHSEDIFVSGGTSGSIQQCLVRFLTAQNRWNECQPMLEGRCYHILEPVGDSLYAIGGFFVNDPVKSIERYKISDNKWEKVGELAEPVGGLSAAVLNNIIYIFGGKCNRLEKDTSVFQSFNTQTGTSCILGNLPMPTCWSQAVAVDNVIHTFCPNGQVLGFNGCGLPTIMKLSPNLDCSHFSVVYHLGVFFIIQVGDFKYHDEIRMFNLNTGEVQIIHERLPRSLCDSKWMKVVINRCHLKYECLNPTHTHR